MTYAMAQAELEGFPVQYGEEIVRHLNRVVSARMKDNTTLKEIGEAVSPYVRHALNDDTKDGYTWYGGLYYDVNGARVAVLFPWHQDWKHPETQMDRSINVYSDRELPQEVVGNLLEQIAYQTALRVPLSKRI